jgi:hypothetical protein
MQVLLKDSNSYLTIMTSNSKKINFSIVLPADACIADCLTSHQQRKLCWIEHCWTLVFEKLYLIQLEKEAAYCLCCVLRDEVAEDSINPKSMFCPHPAVLPSTKIMKLVSWPCKKKNEVRSIKSMNINYRIIMKNWPVNEICARKQHLENPSQQPCVSIQHNI